MHKLLLSHELFRLTWPFPPYNPNNGPNKEEQLKTANPSAGCSCFVCPSLRHDAAEAATSLPPLSHASVHLGRVAVRLLCQDVTAFLVLQIQLGKAGKRKELH